MKNIMKPLRFLEDHIAVILAVFCPAWVGIFLVLMIGLPLLPEKIARKVSPEPLHIMLAVLGSLVICVLIAILRMVRDVKAGKPKQILIYPLLIALDIFFMLYVLNLYVALQLKQDNANTSGNLSHISNRLFMYEMEHGGYPPQQDMKSLLDTLGIGKSDLRKTFFFDVYSAEYHAPAEDSYDPNETIITIRTKWFVPESCKATLLFLRREGSVGTEYLKDKNPPPETKQENNRSAAIPDPE